MANIFDTPTQQNYVETHIPLPLEEMGKLASKWTDNYNAGKSLLGGLDKVAQKIEVAPKDQYRKQLWLNKYSKQLNDVAEKGVQNPGLFADASFQNEIQQTINQAANDPELNLLNLNKKSWDIYSNDRAKGIGQDLHYIGEDQNSLNGLEQNRPGTLYNATVTKYADPLEAMGKIVNGIQESGYLSDSGIDLSRGIEVQNGQYTAYNSLTGGRKGISPKDVKTIATLGAENYGKTDAGKWMLQKYLKDNYSDQLGESIKDLDYDVLKRNSFSGNKADKDLFDEVNDLYVSSIFNYGAKQIHQFKTDKNKTTIVSRKDYNKPQENPGGAGGSVPGDVEGLGNLPDFIQKVVEKDADGNPKMDWNAAQKRPSSALIGSGSPQGQTQQEYVDEVAKRANWFKNTAKAIGWTGKVSVDTYDDILKENKRVETVLNSDYKLEVPEAKIYKDDIMKNPNQYEFFDANGKGVANPISTSTNLKISVNPERIKRKDYYSVVQVDVDGVKYIARNTNKEQNKYYDVATQQQKNSMSYIKDQKIENNKIEKISEIENSLGLNDKSVNWSTSDFKGIKGKPKVIDFIYNQKGETIVTLADEKNPRNQYIVKYNENKIPDNQVNELFNMKDSEINKLNQNIAQKLVNIKSDFKNKTITKDQALEKIKNIASTVDNIGSNNGLMQYQTKSFFGESNVGKNQLKYLQTDAGMYKEESQVIEQNSDQNEN